MTVAEKQWTGPLSGHKKAHTKITEVQTIELKDGSIGILHPIYSNEVSSLTVSDSLSTYLYEQFNLEVERGLTYPHLELLTKKEFLDYFFASFTAIFLKEGSHPSDVKGDWKKDFLGVYYIKPNYIGRCSHICNAGFLVNSKKRGLKIGSKLGESYLKWAPKLGYTYSVFNLVFESNQASVRIWDSLGFERIGRVPKAGSLKGHDELVDAIVFGKDLV
ncbi:hypothetical protein WICMUC_002629 [Wickerhamomyces mucosus]|uniref:N-acetyltransferase domain-containing protein n=1 Tax=Wickerhamomyces mucosus TaxID=1378264 RepID=A0A9P8PQ50_9ASCO|nr:hypothetical protein WICMUC_002629 [Wickerhamomyces mucosus]